MEWGVHLIAGSGREGEAWREQKGHQMQTRRTWKRTGYLPLWLCSIVAASLATGAVAQDAETSSDLLKAPVEHQKAVTDKKVNFVAMPIPISNPELGNGLAVAAMALYSPGQSKRPWTTGVGGFYSDTKSWAVAAFQKAYIDDDKFRVTAGVGTGVFNVDFYGIGQAAGDAGRSIPIEQTSNFAGFEGLMRLAPNLYGGIMFRYIGMKTKIQASQVQLPVPLPDFELDSASALIGIAAEYDTRDTEYGPRKGTYATFQYLYGSEALGSDFEYPRMAVAVNGYHGLSEKAILAWRVSVCASGDDAPFYDLCSYGQNNDLRGYVSGQYRDHFMVATQVEYRRQLYKRWGVVAFAGIGEVAPGVNDLSSENLLPAAGLGLRFAASQKYRVNLSVDYAVGKDSDALYFYIGEAF
jgi:outer membrane protein assembly factor BamA